MSIENSLPEEGTKKVRTKIKKEVKLTTMQKGIKKQIEDNCKKGIYSELFSTELQDDIKLRSEELAVSVTKDEDFTKALNVIIEDAIGIMILNQE